MTRQSPNSTQTLRALCGLAAGLALSCSGCSLLSPERNSRTDYEATKRAIENPSGFEDDEFDEEDVYRPEGLSADRAKRGDSLLGKLGFRNGRRKDRPKAMAQYAAADELFEKAKQLEGGARADAFREAAQQYEAAAENWRSSALEQDALLMAAESHFFAEDFYHSEQFYAKLIKEYPRNPYLDHIDSRRFEIADFWLKTDDVAHKPFVMVNFTDNRQPWNDTGGHGKRVLEKLRLDNPTGKISDDATMRLAMDAYESGDFDEAATTFADLRMTYPDSEHLFNAHFLEIQSLLASYQGPQYSSIPLTDALTRVKQVVKQFPAEAEAKQKELNEAYARIRFSIAERIWSAACYRRDRGENGSAKFHFRRIVDEYADTPFAPEAQKGLDELADAPNDPPQRFKSLVWLFGDTTNARPWEKSSDRGAVTERYGSGE